MAVEILRRVLGGFGCAAILLLIALTILIANDVELTLQAIRLNLLGSMAMGGYFAVASLIFEYDKWSPLKQIVIHFSLSVLLFFPIALGVGWLPPRLLPMVAGLGMFLVFYLIFWVSFTIYFRRQAKALNDSVSKPGQRP